MIGYVGNETTLDFYAGATFYVKEELIGYKTIGRLFHALNENEVSGILVPFINAKSGIFYEGIHRLVESHYHIERYIELDVSLQLVSVCTDVKQVQEIIGTKSDLEGCYLSIQGLNQTIKKTVVDSRKAALDLMKETTQAAIVTNFHEHRHHVLRSNLRDQSFNTHSYLLIGTKLQSKGFHNRLMLSMMFDPDKKNVIYDVLHEITVHDYDVVQLFTRLNVYGMVIVIEANLEDDDIKRLFELLKLKTKQLQILGSYYQKLGEKDA